MFQSFGAGYFLKVRRSCFDSSSTLSNPTTRSRNTASLGFDAGSFVTLNKGSKMSRLIIKT